MSQGYKGGWGHFAKSFMDGYVEDRKEEDRKENDLFKIKAQRWLNEETSFNSAKSKDKALVEQAKAIVASETLAPKGSEFTIYQGLKAGKSVDSIISDIRRSGTDAWENFIPKPPENTGGIVPVEEQMDDLLDGNTTVFNPDSDTTLEGKKSPLDTVDSRPELSDDDKRVMEMLGVEDADYFSQIRSGYSSGGDLKQNYTFTTKPKPGKQPTTAEGYALELYRNSEEFQTLSPAEQVKGLREFKETWTAKGKEKTTYTVGNYTNDLIKYEQMLLSDDPAKVEEANQWMAVVKPIKEKVLIATSNLGSGPEDSLSIQYTDTEGNITNGSGRLDSKGNAKLDNGQLISKDSVVNVQTADMADNALNAINAASTIYKGVGTARTGSLVAVENLYKLEQTILKNEKALTTLAGAGSSVFDSFKTEVVSLGSLLDETIGTDPDADSKSILDALNENIQDRVGAYRNELSQDVADVYKEFNAQLVRAVFSAGKAQGQTGTSFSNKDFDNIMKSLKNSNSYESFSQNLRNFGSEMYSTWGNEAKTARDNPILQKARQFQSNRELIDASTVGPEEYYTTVGKDKAYIYDWVNSKPSAQSAQRTLIENAGDAEIMAGMPESLRGKKVLRVITKQEDGSLTSTFSEAK